MYEYQFQKIGNFNKGSIELIKEGIIVTNKTLDDDNCEHLLKNTFLLPANENPVVNIEVWKFSLVVNIKKPSDEFYYWVLCLNKYANKNATIYNDKRIKTLIDYLWGEYVYFKYVYLVFSVLPLILLYIQGFLIFTEKGHTELVFIKNVFSITILSCIILLLIYEFLLILITSPKSYFSKSSSFVKLITISFYIGTCVINLTESKKRSTAMNIYACTILSGCLWFIMNLQITELFRKLCYK